MGTTLVPWGDPVSSYGPYKRWVGDTSLVVQLLRIHLPMQGTRVQSLVQEDPNTSQQLSPCTTTTEACVP